MIVSSALSGACPLDESPPGGERVALDVVVQATGVAVFPDPIERDCRCSSRFLTDGSCDLTWTDTVGCVCDGEALNPPLQELWGCIEEIRGVAADGVETVGVRDLTITALPAETQELIVVGCGAESRIDLRGLPEPEAVSVEDARRTGVAAADAALAVANATHAQACVDTDFTVRCCDGAPGRVPLPAEARVDEATTVLAAIAGPVEMDAATGPVRVWRRAQRSVGPGVRVPEPSGNLWAVDVHRLPVLVTAVFEMPVESMEFDPSPPGSITLIGPMGTVHLGAEEDRIDLDVGEGVRYGATLAHEPLSRLLPLGEVVATELVVPPVPLVLTRADDAGLTLEGTFEVHARLPAIARP